MGSATFTAEPSTNVIVEPVIAATRTHIPTRPLSDVDGPGPATSSQGRLAKNAIGVVSYAALAAPFRNRGQGGCGPSDEERPQISHSHVFQNSVTACAGLKFLKSLL